MDVLRTPDDHVAALCHVGGKPTTRPLTTTRATAGHRRLAAAAMAVASAAVFLGACGSTAATAPSTTATAAGGTGSSGSTTASVPPSTPGTKVAESMRTKRYCEVLLVTITDGQATGEVHGSYPLNDCPEQLWTKLDPKAIAARDGATLAVLNGPRYWLMDRVEKDGGVAGLTQKDFGGIAMYRLATVAIGSLAEAAKPYTVHEVSRSTVFTFDAGQTVYELTAADGTRYVMQSWSQQKDAKLAEADLAGLGARLQVPAGWRYTSRMLEAPLQVVTTAAPARVLQDELGNSYSQETGN